MQVGRGEPVELLARVVHPVEAPEEWDTVRRPVAPVGAHDHDGQCLDELERRRLAGDGVLPGRRGRRRSPAAGTGPADHAVATVPQDRVHEEVRDVGPPSGAEDPLLTAESEQSLERHEDGGEQEKGDQRVEHRQSRPGRREGTVKTMSVTRDGADYSTAPTSRSRACSSAERPRSSPSTQSLSWPSVGPARS